MFAPSDHPHHLKSAVPSNPPPPPGYTIRLTLLHPTQIKVREIKEIITTIQVSRKIILMLMKDNKEYYAVFLKKAYNTKICSSRVKVSGSFENN